MEQDVARALANFQQQLNQLRSALGVNTADEAETEVQELRTAVEGLANGFAEFLSAFNGTAPATPQDAALALVHVQDTVSALVAWAAPQGFVTPH